jgi:hypothetical protein
VPFEACAHPKLVALAEGGSPMSGFRLAGGKSVQTAMTSSSPSARDVLAR